MRKIRLLSVITPSYILPPVEPSKTLSQAPLSQAASTTGSCRTSLLTGQKNGQHQAITLSDVIASVRTRGVWNEQAGDVVVNIVNRVLARPVRIIDTRNNIERIFNDGDARHIAGSELTLLYDAKTQHYDAQIISADGRRVKVKTSLDGDCFYRAILIAIYQDLSYTSGRDIQRMRNQFADYIASHADELEEFVADSEAKEEQLINTYPQIVGTTKLHADQLVSKANFHATESLCQWDHLPSEIKQKILWHSVDCPKDVARLSLVNRNTYAQVEALSIFKKALCFDYRTPQKRVAEWLDQGNYRAIFYRLPEYRARWRFAKIAGTDIQQFKSLSNQFVKDIWHKLGFVFPVLFERDFSFSHPTCERLRQALEIGKIQDALVEKVTAELIRFKAECKSKGLYQGTQDPFYRVAHSVFHSLLVNNEILFAVQQNRLDVDMLIHLIYTLGNDAFLIGRQFDLSMMIKLLQNEERKQALKRWIHPANNLSTFQLRWLLAAPIQALFEGRINIPFLEQLLPMVSTQNKNWLGEHAIAALANQRLDFQTLNQLVNKISFEPTYFFEINFRKRRMLFYEGDRELINLPGSSIETTGGLGIIALAKGYLTPARLGQWLDEYSDNFNSLARIALDKNVMYAIAYGLLNADTLVRWLADTRLHVVLQRLPQHDSLDSLLRGEISEAVLETCLRFEASSLELDKDILARRAQAQWLEAARQSALQPPNDARQLKSSAQKKDKQLCLGKRSCCTLM